MRWSPPLTGRPATLAPREIWDDKADNLRRAWAHYEAGDARLTTRPSHLSVELTRNCNFRCTMCEQSWDPRFARYEPGYNLSPALFDKISRELFPKAIAVELGGAGEPTLAPYWADVVDAAERFPFVEWSLTSNLSLRRDQVWEHMMKRHFVVGASIDGARAETFEAIRRGADFDGIVHNLAALADARARHGGGYVYFISVIQRANAHELRALVELAAAHGVREVQFRLMRHYDQPGADEPAELGGALLLDGTRLARWAAQAIDAGLDLGVTVTFDAPLFTRRLDRDRVARAAALPPRAAAPSLFHGAPWSAPAAVWRARYEERGFAPFSRAAVSADGTLTPAHGHAAAAGDLRQGTVDEIWNSANFSDRRSRRR